MGTRDFVIYCNSILSWLLGKSVSHMNISFSRHVFGMFLAFVLEVFPLNPILDPFLFVIALPVLIFFVLTMIFVNFLWFMNRSANICPILNIIFK